MPLSARFDELVENLELKDALWHLERANAGTDYHATEAEIAQGYRLLLDIIEDTGGRVQALLTSATEHLQTSRGTDEMVQERLGVVRDLWTAKQGDAAILGLRERQEDLQDEIASYQRAKALRARAVQILDGKGGVNVPDIRRSITNRDDVDSETVRGMVFGENTASETEGSTESGGAPASPQPSTPAHHRKGQPVAAAA